MGKPSSFEALSVHPTLVAALRRMGVQPTPFQARVLATTTIDFADVLVDGRAAGGANSSTNSGGAAGADGNASSRAVTAERHALLTVFATHCVLSAKDPSRSTAVVVASNKDFAAQLQKSMKAFASQCHIDFQMITNEGQPPPPPVGGAVGDSGEKGLSAVAFASKGGRVLITTLRVLHSWGKEFLRSVTTLAVEDASRSSERQLEDILRWLTIASPSSSAAGSSHPTNNLTASRQKTNILLMCLAPLTKVSVGIRYHLSRRNRRYYHLQGPSSAAGSVLPTASGTAPPSSTQLVHLLYLDERDREDLLRRVLQTYHSRRVVLLTHHKEIKHLHQTIAKWGLYHTNNDANSKGSDYMCCMLRSDTAERQESSFMGFLRETKTNTNNAGGGSNGDNNTSSSALLVGWDAFTAVDLMDVDVFIQYYPPQKSLTERERAEFVQVLHTTADPENSRRGRRTLLITFLAINDFTLAAFFMQQYGQTGPILNLAANHPDFQRCILDPKTVLRKKQKKEAGRRQKDRDDGGQYPNTSSSASGAAASAPVPLPRSMRQPSPGGRKDKEQYTGSGRNKGNTNAAAASSGGDGRPRGVGRWGGEARGQLAGSGDTVSGAGSACVSPPPADTR
ncbi:hypothetical protein TraAM80_03380 [Trypanosoma rangeli]|uniref:Uncharacterized protein n=1 Tax=Trypanosoma rangeli TaxID=5698 RepID=A0A3R7M1E6_TRYRA|nr:uncharacterized protein TraAM80_03380 [Trypanosoma rangeli]RNF07259.1 hypothetical protein TraAM80_03380 [Trypanosoma rangeli]|eukprot:RNF07259.1 hypothetical protein TraAM80_03380 [Trypanosoma rangeli]